MNTLEARPALSELTARAIVVVEGLVAGDDITATNTIEMREILREARDVVYDAGYIGDAPWRALLKANVYVTAPPSAVGRDFWQDILGDLRDAQDSLNGITETADI